MSPNAFKRSTCIVIYRHFASKVKSQDSPKMSWSSHGMNLESVFPVIFIWSLSLNSIIAKVKVTLDESFYIFSHIRFYNFLKKDEY